MTAEVSGSVGAAPRRRPKDRKAQIIRVAARAFSEHGYHAVGVDEIAATVGISGPALYRHFPNKYALFSAAAEWSVTSTLDAVTGAGDPGATPAARLRAVISALVAAIVDNRREGGLYRWERRYLERADRLRLRAKFAALNTAVAAPLRAARPDLSTADAATLAAAILSTASSISGHYAVLSAARIQSLITQLCWTVAYTDLPAPPPLDEPPAVPVRGQLALASRRERLVAEAIRVFGQRGYFDASIDEIGAAAGLNASSVYRYFPSKADLLAAAFHQAADRVWLLIADSVAESATAREAADRIARRYARLLFAYPDVMTIYLAEFANVPEHDQARLRERTRQNISEIVHLLPAPADEARFRVHAALALVLDLGRVVRFDARPAQVARVATLMSTVMFGT